MSGRWFPGITPSRPAPVDIDTGVPHPARIYDYILGGKDSFAADQAAARAAIAANPHLVTAMRENRAAMAIQHATADFYPPGGGTAGAYNRAGIPFQYRTRDEFERFVAGLQLVPPRHRPDGGMACRRRAAAAPVSARGRRLRGRRP